mmetsp:Transcript_28367/g.59135  ORF Transcript_28367/g.59135 Transcript_28367/m.59135 type:complete len:167 (+) Transcript_28367:186-686(+)
MGASNELRSKIAEYGNFISRTLQPQLQTAVEAREETEAEISEYAQLQGKLRQIEKAIVIDPNTKSKSVASINTIVDISHAAVYCKASISNPRTIYVNVGFGFHIEMTLPEAILFVDRRMEYLGRDVLNHRSEVAMTVAKDVENALELLKELGEELEELEGHSKRND